MDKKPPRPPKKERDPPTDLCHGLAGHGGAEEMLDAHGTDISMPEGEAAVPKQADTAKAKTRVGHVSYEAVVPRWREKCDEHNRGCLKYAGPRSSFELDASATRVSDHPDLELEDSRAAGETKSQAKDVEA